MSASATEGVDADPVASEICEDASLENTAGVLKRSRVPASCMKAFDSLYWCYSPVHQARQYYMTGELDDCRGRMRRFRMCIMSRFRHQEAAEKIYEEYEEGEKMEKAQHEPVWEIRQSFLEKVYEEDQREEAEIDANHNKKSDTNNQWWL